MVEIHGSASVAWLHQVKYIIDYGNVVSPRDQPTREVLNFTTAFNMQHPVNYVKDRRISYKFMAAEALWILSGDDRVETIAPYNPRIREFSDDGETFFGAYGPRVLEQLDYVIDKLLRDVNTRQAVLTTWRPNPPNTRDVPCTISLTFTIRNNKLNVHAFMRSSDVWLGIPYDVFSFSVIGYRVICALNIERSPKQTPIAPGALFLTAASSHLYESNFEDARSLMDTMYEHEHNRNDKLLEALVSGDWLSIKHDIQCCRDKEGTPLIWEIRPWK